VPSVGSAPRILLREPRAAEGRSPVAWVIVAALPLILARACLPGLTDPSESRYAQVAREMAESGDPIVPTWQGVPHLEKPPLAYWSAALGILVLGRNELAVRLGSVLALVASGLLAAGIARRLAGARAAAPAAAAILLTPFPVSAGGACLTEPFLLLATTLFHHSVARHLRRESPRALDAAAVALATGFLAKGYMVLLFTVVPLALADVRLLREVLRPRRVAILLALAVPWFAAVELRCPGYFAQQLAGLGARASGSGHRAPFPVYAAVLVGGLLPFAVHAARGLVRTDGAGRRLLLLWLGVPLVVLTVAPSRQWTYILPAAPPLAVLAGAGLATGRRGPVMAYAAACAVVGAALLALPPLLAIGLPAHLVARSLGCALVLGGLWLAATRRVRPDVALAGLALLLTAGVVHAACVSEQPFRIHRRLASEAAAMAAREHRPLVVAGMSMPSVAFYSDAPVVIAGEDGSLVRESKLWGGSPWFLPEVDLRTLLACDTRSVIVVKENTRAALAPDWKPVLCRDGISVLSAAPRAPQGD
jgi:4-amino-4-deoxy-L-arabinose transferase-like glycosyltransferase